MPEVSVIITTYLRPFFLERALNSVLSQSYNDYEIIVVDDNNEGDIHRTQTEAVIAKFTAKTNIKYIKHSRNKNGGAARNSGLNVATGEYIAFLDDDDEWFPDKLKLQIECFTKSGGKTGLVTCSYMYRANHVKKTVIQNNSVRDSNLLLLKNTIGSNSLPLIKKECFDHVGSFDTRLPSCQDWDMWLRISNEYSIDFISDVLVTRNIHERQITGDIEKKITGRQILFHKHYQRITNNDRVLSDHLYKLGRLYVLAGRSSMAFQYLKKSFSIYPFRILVYIHLIFCFYTPTLHRHLIRLFGVPRFGKIRLYH